MNSHRLALSSLLAAAILIAASPSHVRGETVPENDFALLEPKIRKNAKDTSDIRSWFEKNLKPMDASYHMFTPDYSRFLEDVGLFNWDGSVTEQQLRRKWSKRFDVDRRVPDHAFETGNCGWGTQKLTKFDYLGELNDGEWFRLTIKGGCGDDDYSQSITRVIKVISSDGRYRIANLICP